MEEDRTGGDGGYSVAAAGGLDFDVEGGRDQGAVAGVCRSGAVVSSSNEESGAAEREWVKLREVGDVMVFDTCAFEWQ